MRSGIAVYRGIWTPHPNPLPQAERELTAVRSRIGATRRAITLPTSELPCIAERERGDAAGVFVQDQGARDWRFGALAAIFALAEPAVDADRRALGLLEVHPRSVDQARRMANFTAEPDGETRLRQRVRRHRTAHHLRDRKIPGAVGQFDHLLQQAVGCIEGGVHVP